MFVHDVSVDPENKYSLKTDGFTLLVRIVVAIFLEYLSKLGYLPCLEQFSLYI